jgi:hypothetical protein
MTSLNMSLSFKSQRIEYGVKNVPSNIFFVCKKFKISDLLPEVRTSFKVYNFLLAL